MLKIIKVTLFATIVCFAGIANSEEVNMNPGLWEWTAIMQMPPNVPQIPPQVNRKCLTKKGPGASREETRSGVQHKRSQDKQK